MHIIFEGSDGMGKTTVAEMVVDHLKKQSREVIFCKHPGATKLGQKLRHLVKHDDTIEPLSDHVTQMLMLADYQNFIEHVLNKNPDKIIVSDRCNIISGLIYSIASDAETEKWLPDLYSNIRFPKADCLFLLWSPFDVARRRMINRGGEKCKIEGRGEEYLRKVNEAYLNHVGKFGDIVNETHLIHTSYTSTLKGYVDISVGSIAKQVCDIVDRLLPI